MPLENGYIQASSENLPRVDLEMMLDFITESDLYNSAELRGKKTLRFLIIYCTNYLIVK